jgi:rubrerythrin
MGNIFSGSEIVELGIQVERNGKDFYDAMALKSQSPKVKKVFQYLSGEEARHIGIFEKILERADRYEPPENYAQDYLAYMNALASEYVFTQKDKGAQIAKGITGDREAADMGIKFEKDSIIFYEGMKRFIPAEELKIVEALIAQEQLHLKQLWDLKHSL